MNQYFDFWRNTGTESWRKGSSVWEMTEAVAFLCYTVENFLASGT